MKRIVKKIVERFFYESVQPRMTENQVMALTKEERRDLLLMMGCAEKKNNEGGKWGTEILMGGCYVNRDGNIFVGFHNAFQRDEKCIQYSLTPTPYKVIEVSKGQINKMNFLKWFGVDVFSRARTWEEHLAIVNEIKLKELCGKSITNLK